MGSDLREQIYWMIDVVYILLSVKGNSETKEFYTLPIVDSAFSVFLLS